jgi:hypothetical protein
MTNKSTLQHLYDTFSATAAAYIVLAKEAMYQLVVVQRKRLTRSIEQGC